MKKKERVSRKAVQLSTIFLWFINGFHFERKRTKNGPFLRSSFCFPFLFTPIFFLFPFSSFFFFPRCEDSSGIDDQMRRSFGVFIYFDIRILMKARTMFEHVNYFKIFTIIFLFVFNSFD